MRTALFVALLWSTQTLGATYIVNDESLVSVPNTVISGIKKFETELPIGFNNKPCKFIGKLVALRQPGAVADWITTTKDACTWGASTAPVWVLVKKPNNAYEVLFFVQANDVTVVNRASQHGLKHIKTIRATDSYKEVRLWKFDGKAYKLAKIKFHDVFDP